MLKCICIEIFDNILSANMKDREKPKSFLPYVYICFRSRDVSFESLENLEKKCDKKIEHFVLL